MIHTTLKTIFKLLIAQQTSSNNGMKSSKSQVKAFKVKQE